MTTPTPDEICERLRDYGGSIAPYSADGDSCIEAADLIQQQQATIERLSAENERLRESLRLKIAALGKE